MPVNGHAQDVRRALQKGYVVRGELAFGAAVDFEDAKRLAVALEDHIHGAVDAMLQQQLRRAEALFVFEMIGDDRLAGAQGIAGGRCHVGANGRGANDAWVPADAGAHQETALRRHELQNLGEFRLQAFGSQPGGQIEQFRKRRALQSFHAKFRQNLLLPDPLAQRFGRQIFSGRPIRGRFGHKLGGFGVKRDDASHCPTFKSKSGWTG